MENLITFIFGAQGVSFTPDSLVRYAIFVLILTCISGIAQSILSIGGDR